MNGQSRELFWSVGGHNNNNNKPIFWVDTSKSKNTDHGFEETCAIMSTQVTYEIDHISLLQGSTISNALHFCFLCILS